MARRQLNMDEYKMMISGYSEYQRRIIVTEGLARVKNLKRKEELDMRPLYRMASGKKQERGVEKMLKAKKWAVKVESMPG